MTESPGFVEEQEGEGEKVKACDIYYIILYVIIFFKILKNITQGI